MTAQATPINVTGTGIVVTGACTFRGFSLGSTAGSTVVIYDNTSASGTVLASFTLAANDWKAEGIADGLRCTTGLFLSCSGTVAGHLRVG